MKYIHPHLNCKVDAIGGHYLLSSEGVLDINDERILYFTGHAVTDRACCGAGGCGYAIVAGYIIAYRSSITGDGRYISEIMPVPEPRLDDITGILKKKEGVNQIHFLTPQNVYKIMF